jgi:hypothetical protein
MEPINGQQNYLWVTIRSSFSVVGADFRCCKTKDEVSKKLDDLGPAAKQMYGKEFTKDVRCLIQGIRICEECGSSCDICTRSPCG